MPTKDRPALITEAVAGIMDQDFEDWELVIEDGSASPICSVLPNDQRIRYAYSPECAERHNKALWRCHGDLLNFCADDDVMESGTLTHVHESIADRRWLYGRIRGGQTNSAQTNQIFGSPWDYRELQFRNFVPLPAAFWTRESRDAVGGFDPLVRFADWDYWLRLGARWEPMFTDRVLSYYRMHASQDSASIQPAEWAMHEGVIQNRVSAGYYL